MKAIITGARGTVGAALVDALRRSGGEPIAWDRSRVPLDDYQDMLDFVRATAPGAIYHLAMASQPTGRENEGWLVNYHWPSELAGIARELGIPFIYTSSVMVYTNRINGPFHPHTPPDETEGYGAEKRRTEERVLSQNPNAVVVRLGWQIGPGPGGNNMVDHLDRQRREHGTLRASSRWLPACSPVEDTAAALITLANAPGGIYHASSNRDMNFHEIVTALAKKHRWQCPVEETTDYTHDQRLLDDRVPMRDLREALAAR